jgi:hypothetical protein
MKSNQKFILIIPILIMAACSPAIVELDPVDPTSTSQNRAEPVDQTSEPGSAITTGTSIGLTYQREDGNRFVDGRGNIIQSDPLEIPLVGEVRWLVATPYQGGSLWTAALEDGTLERFLVQDSAVERLDPLVDPLPAGSPPLLMIQDQKAAIYGQPLGDSSLLTHPIHLNPHRKELVYITENGDLVLFDDGAEIERLPVNALPDARLISDGRGRLLFLSDPTDRYDHGVLGDRLEAGSITLVKTKPHLEIVTRIEISSPAVIEGVAPIWMDLDGDGTREILVTVSDFRDGARLVLYNESGQILAQSPGIGQGYRWRHQLAAAPLGPAGEILIVDVLRPHLDATLEFFQWKDDSLILLADLPGFSTHQIGSRNLDMGLIGDLDSDGRLEVVAPDKDYKTLNGIGLDNGFAQVLWSVPLHGTMTSNLSGVTLEDGSLVVGVGVGNTLLVWE